MFCKAIYDMLIDLLDTSAEKGTYYMAFLRHVNILTSQIVLKIIFVHVYCSVYLSKMANPNQFISLYKWKSQFYLGNNEVNHVIPVIIALSLLFRLVVYVRP